MGPRVAARVALIKILRSVVGAAENSADYTGGTSEIARSGAETAPVPARAPERSIDDRQDHRQVRQAQGIGQVQGSSEAANSSSPATLAASLGLFAAKMPTAQNRLIAPKAGKMSRP